MTKNSYQSSHWLAYCRPNTKARLRLFCFPYAGGSAIAYRDWAKVLPGELDVCPVQLPGRETRIRESAQTRMGPLVEAVCHGLLPYLDRPFCFFGHSMGGLVSFEVARHLSRVHGLPPSLLVVSGTGAPHIPYQGPLRYNLPENEMLRQLKDLDGTPKEVLESSELMQLVLSILRADLEVYEFYEFEEEPPLPCSIRACGGMEDPWTSREDLEAWKNHTQGKFDLWMFQGGHFFIESARNALLQMLTRELSQLISEA